MKRISPEERQRLAQQLANNRLLPELLDEQRKELRHAWESEPKRKRRESLWHRLQATNDLKDFIYGRLNELTGRETG